MSFPEPLKLPRRVYQKRVNRKKELLKVALIGISVRSIMAIIQLIGYWFFQSSALFVEGVATSIDILSTIFLAFSIKIAARPPDHDHPFGHGRTEPIFGMQLSLILTIIGGVIVVQQLTTFPTWHIPLSYVKYTWIFPLIVFIGLQITSQLMSKAAAFYHSPVLKVEARHIKIDSYSSFLITLAFAFAAFFPEISSWIDHLGAIGVAVTMILFSIFSLKENMDQLMDKKPDQGYFDQVKKAALGVTEVADVEKVRIQLFGPNAHVDIDIEVDPQMPVWKAHQVSQQVRLEIQKAWSFVQDVIVHIEPHYPNDH